MSSPADLPGSTSPTSDLDDLQQRIERQSPICGTSTLLKQYLISGRTKLQAIPRRYLRHGFIALSIPAALIAGTVIPAAQPVATVAPVAAAYAVQAGMSAFGGDTALADNATADDFVFTNGARSLGAPVEALYAPVTVDVANLRRGPGTNYERIGKLQQGQTVRLLGRNGDWYQVETKGGYKGWIHGELVEVSSGVANTLAIVKVSGPTAPAASKVRVGATTDENVNLREGPGTSHGVIAKLANGTQLEVLGQQDGWYRVATSKGTVGWVTDDYFKVLSGPTASVANGPISASVAANSVNLRKGPSTRFGSFGRMAKGVAVQVLARNGDWYKVRSPRGNVGWVAQDLILISPAAAAAVPITKDVPAVPKPVANSQPAPAAAAAAPTIASSNDAASLALRYIGSRYVYGGSSPSGFDCSGLTKYVYGQLGIALPHKASAQFSTRYGQQVGLSDLAPGDLVFFVRTTGARGITHVALYVGNGMMVSANTPRTGVQYVSIYGKYWQSRFAGGLRPFR